MNKKILLLLLLIISISYAGVFELYGIGKVGLNYSVASLGRGKSSVAYSDTLTVNLQNPANLAYINKAGMEMSANTDHNVISGTGNTNNYTGFSYGVLKFPLAQRGAFILGLVPLTTSNASYQIVDELNQYRETARSIGNIYSVSIGVGYAFFKKHQLALGFSADFLIGGYTISKDIEFDDANLTPVSIEIDEGFSGSQFTGGISYTPFKQLTLGAAYSYVNSSSRREIIQYTATSSSYFYSYLDTINYLNTAVFPNQLRIGLALTLAPRYIFTADWMQYQFTDLASDFSFNPFYEGSQIKPFNHYGLGFEKQGQLSEYLPYYQSLTYRGGIFYEQHYMADSQGIPVQTYGLTLGLGIPFTKYQNRVDMTFICEYNIGTIYEQAGISPINVSEFVYHFNISISIAETWFNTRGKYR